MYLAISVDLTYARMLKAQDGIEMRRHEHTRGQKSQADDQAGPALFEKIAELEAV